MDKPLQEVRILRRVNLGNYEHYELEVKIYDEDEFHGACRGLILLGCLYQALGIKEAIDITKVRKPRKKEG